MIISAENKKDSKEISKVIFFDLTILIDLSENSDKSIEEIRECYIKYHIRPDERELFDSLNDDEVEMMYQWDNTYISRLSSVKRCCGDNADIVFLSDKYIDADKFRIMCKFQWITPGDVIVYSDKENLVDSINSYINKNSRYGGYAIISRTDLRNDFQNRMIFVNSIKPDFKEMCARVYGMFQYDINENFSWYIDELKADEETPFYKVIFLDIDGVLNDEGKNYDKGVKLDSDMVKNLAYIVKMTGADVILSSSWKYGYERFIENNYQSNDPAYQQLHTMLAAEGITIKGITPISQESGSVARPFEIREWLNRYPYIFSYVILDDDTFWQWGYLQRNVITTRTPKSPPDRYERYVKGLTMAHAEKAIAILNEQGADNSDY